MLGVYIELAYTRHTRHTRHKHRTEIVDKENQEMKAHLI